MTCYEMRAVSPMGCLNKRPTSLFPGFSHNLTHFILINDKECIPYNVFKHTTPY